MAGSAADVASTEDFLQLLAKAVRQFHTYPATSPICADAVAACHKSFASVDRDRLPLRVTPTEIIVDGAGIGSGTIIEHELVRRLYGARVVGLDIDRAATLRHLMHFCAALLRCEALSDTKTTLAELLAEQGVDTIVPLMALRPEVLDVGAPSNAVCHLVEHEQRRRDAMFAGGAVDHLYPPEKGWVRIDPAARLASVSLVDLALLVDSPADVATLLLRLTDDDPSGPEEQKNALERKFSDVTMLFSSLEPKVARVMFSKLARAVLDLEPVRRKTLLQRTILPGLLDGRADGSVLQDFPDVDLADSLCLLLELEAAAPEMLTTALNRLQLSDERRQAVIPLVDARLAGGTDVPGDRSEERAIDRLARRLVRVDAGSSKDFSEFAAFDLSIDSSTEATLADARTAIGATDVVCTELGFLTSLVRLQANPAVAGAFLTRAQSRFTALERSGRWTELAARASALRQLAATLQSTRPDIADAVHGSLTGFFAHARAAALVDLHQGDAEGRRLAHTLVDGFGAAVVPGLAAIIDDPAQQSRAAGASALLSDRAALLAPALALHLEGASSPLARTIVKILGQAGAGHEAAIATQLSHADEQVAREALRALAKVGTNQAAALVARHVQNGSAGGRAAAEEALWHFPAPRAAMQVCQLLGNRDFVVQNPDAATRLLARAAHNGTHGLESVLADLESLRFHIWNPGVVRVALKARELRTR